MKTYNFSIAIICGIAIAFLSGWFGRSLAPFSVDFNNHYYIIKELKEVNSKYRYFAKSSNGDYFYFYISSNEFLINDTIKVCTTKMDQSTVSMQPMQSEAIDTSQIDESSESTDTTPTTPFNQIKN